MVQSAAHLELSDAQPVGFFAGFVVDFAESLDVIGNEGDGHDADLTNLLGAQVAQSPVQGRLQPFAGADFALIAEAVTIGPSTALHQKPYRIFNLPLVGVTFGDHGHRDAVRAEDEFGALRHWKSCQRFFNFFDYGV